MTLFIMPSKSPAQQFAAQQAMDIKTGKKSPSQTTSGAVSMSKMPMSKLKHFMKLKESMTSEQKRKLLKILRTFKEEYTGNVGGETDIANPDNFVSEDEFTAATKPEQNVVAKTFDTKADFDSYVNQRRGIEMTPKEMQAIVTELAQTPSQPSTPSNLQSQPASQDQEITVDDPIRITKSVTFTDETEGANILANLIKKLELSNEKPTQRDRFFVKYEETDDFGNNSTVVIKKLKEGNQFCWTAFSKHESAEEEGKPEGHEPEGSEENDKSEKMGLSDLKEKYPAQSFWGN